jgi:hypothetical protein
MIFLSVQNCASVLTDITRSWALQVQAGRKL